MNKIIIAAIPINLLMIYGAYLQRGYWAVGGEWLFILISIGVLVGLVIERRKQRKRMEERRRRMRLEKIRKASNEQGFTSRQQTSFNYPTIAVGNSQIKNAQ
jgi:heme exporter protein D